MNLLGRFRVASPVAFAFCETMTAGPDTPHHIRRLDRAGLKIGGGASTPALCGRNLGGGWDLPEPVTAEAVTRLRTPRALDGHVFLCTVCADTWKAQQ